MPLTPEDVSNKRFTPVRLREGYDMGEVDQFLDEVEAELARLNKENEELRSKVSGAQTGDGSVPAAATSDLAPLRKENDDLRAQIADLQSKLAAAPATTNGDQGKAEAAVAPVAAAPVQQTLRVETVPEASNAAARLLEIATRNADELVDGAKDDADKIIGEARTKAERLESESKAKADRLESDARQRAQMLDQETAERRTQLFGDLEKEKEKLDAEVANLRSFEREYRSRLKGYFTQQLEALNTMGTEPAAAPGEESPAAPKRLRSILGEEQE
ncbi:DivIVA domain-containing protein [Nocardioides sp. Kera G14]|uniref:DivIVA domain-containing protein n=1 Tax=Nocardioides sp. Kera G14 TaxID=2884264 RepID=UPI002AB082C9|nr:DivIVA domain-containing protein [Nocardioides sp. Kera G14]